MTKRTEPKEAPSSTTADTPTPPPVQPAATTDSARRPFEQHAQGLPAWQLAALRAHTRWAAGRQVTRQQFDKALEAATNEVIR